jgi:uncharacterized membrane protein
MQFEFIGLLILLIVAVPVIALIRTFLLDARIRKLESKSESSQNNRYGIQELTARVFSLERQVRALQERVPATAPPVFHTTVETLTPKETAPAGPTLQSPICAENNPEPASLSFSGYAEPVAPNAPESAAAAEAPKELETNIGLTWINRIAAITLILAAAFFFKYAVDNQWIGETGRIALGVIAGFIALGFGERAWRRDHRVYAQGVTALGVAVLYLSFYAAFAFYHLPVVPQTAAFLLMALTCATGGMLAMRYNAIAISVLALLGGYLTPVLLSTGEDRPWILFGYILLLDLGAMAVGRAKKWRHLAPLAMGGTAILYCLWFVGHFNADNQIVATVFAFVFYALFASLESDLLVALTQILASLALLAIAGSLGPGRSWILSNGWPFVGLAAAGLAVPEWRRWPHLFRVTAPSFWICFGIWQGMLPRLHPAVVVPVAIAGFALFLGHQAWRMIVRREKAGEDALALLAVNAAAAFGIGYFQLKPAYHAWLGLAAAAFAGIHLLVAVLVWNGMDDEKERDTTPILLLVGVALAFLTLAIPLQFSTYRITMAWALEGCALAWIGWRAESRRMRQSALLVFALTLFRLLVLDAWIYSNGSQFNLIANARFRPSPSRRPVCG